jgi:hypothetical protein
MNNTQVLTLREAEARTGIKYYTIRRHIMLRNLPANRWGGSYVLSSDVVDRFATAYKAGVYGLRGRPSVKSLAGVQLVKVSQLEKGFELKK